MEAAQEMSLICSARVMSTDVDLAVVGELEEEEEVAVVEV